jgi:hypothetical protein
MHYIKTPNSPCGGEGVNKKARPGSQLEAVVKKTDDCDGETASDQRPGKLIWNESHFENPNNCR